MHLTNRSRTRLAAVLAASMLAALLSVLLVRTGTAHAQTGTRVVNDVPSSATPDIDDGRVLAFTKVGGTMVAGGTFGTVSPRGSSTRYTRSGIVAFDATKGTIRKDFDPDLDGRVEALAPGPNDHTVYVGGSFSELDGEPAYKVALLDLRTGDPVAGFTPPRLNGSVKALLVRGDRLFLGGTFTTVGSVTHGGLATLDAETGAIDPYMGVQLYGHHNWTGLPGQAKGGVGAKAFAVAPAGDRMVVVGNFTTADGKPRDQAVMIDLGSDAASVDTWATSRYSAACSYTSFDSWIRGVDFSPDGSYFAIVGTGGPHNGTLCDSGARWKTAASGDGLEPTWVDWTGGDSLYSVAITGGAIYVGGHQRWMNNPSGHDSPGPGAVPRPGIAALNPGNGLPIAWNPGRHPRGAGAYAMFATEDGLYVGSDTEWIGHYRYHRKRIAYFPLAGGYEREPGKPTHLPGTAYLAGQSGNRVQARSFDGEHAGDARDLADNGGIPWGSVTGATLVDNSTLFYATDDGTFHRSTFDGKNWGNPKKVDPYDDPYWSQFQTGSGQTYRGTKPSFYSETDDLAGMFYADNRLYYATGGHLYWRHFDLDSGTIAQDEHEADGSVDFTGVRGMFLADGTLYFGTRSDGDLHAVSFANGAPSGSPSVVSGPGVDGADWRGSALFLLGGKAAGDEGPVVEKTWNCTGLDCTFDASGSSDPDGKIESYKWSFGDGDSSTKLAPSHSYAKGGTYTARLTVTDDDGATNSATAKVRVSAKSTVSFQDAAAYNDNTKAASVTVPSSVRTGDGLLAFVSVNSSDAPMTGPDGWTRVESDTNHSLRTSLWQRVAAAGDAGSDVTFTTAKYIKVAVQLLAYEGTSTEGPVASATHRRDSHTSAHTTPSVTAAAGSRVLSYWVGKSSSITKWSAIPSNVSVRSASYGTGGGRLTSLAADSGSGVSAGTYGSLTARTDHDAGKGENWTVVLAGGE